ncbi:lipopolysaccharide assembly protein LapA domain-containing protein [Oxalobacteraceae bacterium R-40]|uniref:Lipopolysaccharide assembly protein LapA domain-containing protein n=1 Tax=Keguizhuia sedimenti TaxID=3064264 RepID=A0ABU1BSI1_9BURK|nr:lipopolysaccharide assembly protein LapA domain-containing protein [Oxalobacteraceae bacterium R-40]
MKLLFRIAAGILFIVFFGFALKNTQEATLQFFLNYEIRGPLVLLLLGFFVLGFVFGTIGMASIVIRQKRELAKQKKIAGNLQKENEARALVPASGPAAGNVIGT